MNDADLREVLERITSSVAAPSDLAETAWGAARRRSRRATIAAVGSAGAVGALAVALIGGPLTHDRATAPVTTPTAPTAETTPTTVHSSVPTQPAVSTAGVTTSYPALMAGVAQPFWDPTAAESLDRLPTRLPDVLQVGGAASLESDPMQAALAVAQVPAPDLELRVLGDDQRWRKLDVQSLRARYADSEIVSYLGGAPISPDGRSLAFAQPRSVVLVDLATARDRSIDLPRAGVGAWVSWSTQWSPDGTTLLVGPLSYGERAGSYLVDVETGAVKQVPVDASVTAFAPDGSLIETVTGAGLLGELHEYDGTVERRAVLLGTGVYPQRPALGSAVALVHGQLAWTGPRSGRVNRDGLLVIDPQDGSPLGVLPMRSSSMAEGTTLMGWLDDRTLLFSNVVGDDARARRIIEAWDYETGELSRVSSSWPWNDFQLSLAPGLLRGG